eukprot:20429_1
MQSIFQPPDSFVIVVVSHPLDVSWRNTFVRLSASEKAILEIIKGFLRPFYFFGGKFGRIDPSLELSLSHRSFPERRW